MLLTSFRAFSSLGLLSSTLSLDCCLSFLSSAVTKRNRERARERSTSQTNSIYNNDVAFPHTVYWRNVVATAAKIFVGIIFCFYTELQHQNSSILFLFWQTSSRCQILLYLKKIKFQHIGIMFTDSHIHRPHLFAECLPSDTAVSTVLHL